jgi:chemotaxis protein MotA
MDTLIGIVLCFGMIIFGIISVGGNMGDYLDLPSVIIVIGGSLASAVVGFSFKEIASLPKSMSILFAGKQLDPLAAINSIITLANLARKEGLLALEEASKTINDSFLQKGILLVVDGTDPELVKGILEAEISALEGRHFRGAGIYDHLANMAPAFGMAGTVVGLVAMLASLDDPSTLGAGMATCLITTLYGSMMANILFIPMAGKLRHASTVEVAYREMLLEGMLSIQAGENPRIIEEKLYSFLPRDARSASVAPGGGAAADEE